MAAVGSASSSNRSLAAAGVRGLCTVTVLVARSTSGCGTSVWRQGFLASCQPASESWRYYAAIQASTRELPLLIVTLTLRRRSEADLFLMRVPARASSMH